MNRVPGFTAEASLGPTISGNWGQSSPDELHADGVAAVIPQFGRQPLSGVDWGGYLRCRANGGDDLTCRFFAGLPPFTIGGLFF